MDDFDRFGVLIDATKFIADEEKRKSIQTMLSTALLVGHDEPTLSHNLFNYLEKEIKTHSGPENTDPFIELWTTIKIGKRDMNFSLEEAQQFVNELVDNTGCVAIVNKVRKHY